jgi:ferritin-like metal-binding protein YciE
MIIEVLELMAKEASLQNMFLEDIRDLLDAEKQLVRALPRMAKAASDDELQNALREHLEQTRGQVQRLEQVFELMEERPRGKPCQGMKGIVQEGEEMLEEEQSEAIMDAAIAGAGRKVEHYEMAGYESARALAQQLGMKQAAELLQETLREEMQADKTLAQISKRLVKEASRGERGERSERADRGEARETRRTSQRGRSTPRGKSGAGTQTTTDHDEIRRWAEERRAEPACVKGTAGRGNSCLIRLDFPGYSGEDSLEHISWDEWFENFDRNKLALIYQEKTAGGQKSNFNKLVRRQRAGGRTARAAR